MMMRNYWTPERDEELKRHEAAGLSTSQIAALLQTTRSAVIGRSNRLRGNLFKSDIERSERQRIAAAKTRKKDPHQGDFFAAMGADVAADTSTGIFATLRADLAAGVDRTVVIKRALGAGLTRAVIGEFFGLSISQIYQIAGARQGPPRWTTERVELMLSMWPDHTAAEIADALGTTDRAVVSKRQRMGLTTRKFKNGPPEPDPFPPRASAAGAG
jgi:hypothetical protein